MPFIHVDRLKRFSQTWDIKEVREHVNLLDVLELCKIHLIPGGRKRYSAICPFHNDRHATNFMVFLEHPENEHYHCFQCGAHGTMVDFYMNFKHLDFSEAVNELGSIFGVPPQKAVQSDPTARLKVKQYAEIYKYLELKKSDMRKLLEGDPDDIAYHDELIREELRSKLKYHLTSAHLGVKDSTLGTDWVGVEGFKWTKMHLDYAEVPYQYLQMLGGSK